MKRRNILISISEPLAKQLEKVKKKTGLSMSRQVELALRGYTIRKRIGKKRKSRR